MSLLKIIKKVVLLAPVRCGRTYYSVNIKQHADKIRVTFTPTDDFLMVDPRRENEEFMPEHVHLFEKWQHIGLAVGSLRYFLKENNIAYAWMNSPSKAEILMERVEQDTYKGINKQERLKHAQRTFNSELPVDAETEQALTAMISDFLTTHNGHNITVTDPAIRKKLSALAIYWDSLGDVNGCIRPPQMETTPMMISVPPVEYDIQYWFDMGDLYARLGLTAIDRGYQVAYCNAFNLFDPRVARLEDVLKVKFGTYTVEDFVPRPWICIGKALDPSKPYNWVGVPNRYEDDLMVTCILTTKEYVTVEEDV